MQVQLCLCREQSTDYRKICLVTTILRLAGCCITISDFPAVADYCNHKFKLALAQWNSEDHGWPKASGSKVVSAGFCVSIVINTLWAAEHSLLHRKEYCYHPGISTSSPQHCRVNRTTMSRECLLAMQFDILSPHPHTPLERRNVGDIRFAAQCFKCFDNFVWERVLTSHRWEF